MAATIAHLPEGLLEGVFLALEPPDRRVRRAEAVCRRWQDVSRGSAVLWDAVSWTGTEGPKEQAASLGSFLRWLCWRELPPRQLRLNLRLDEEMDWVAADAAAETWLHMGAALAHCAPRMQQLTIIQGKTPDADGLDRLERFPRDLCLPPLGAWLLPCRQLRRLEVTAPFLVLAHGVLRRLPALEHLRLRLNQTLYGAGPNGLRFGTDSPQLASRSLTSLDLAASDRALRPGVLAALPCLRRLVASSTQFDHTRQLALLGECAGTLEELQLEVLDRPDLPLGPLGALTRLKRLRICEPEDAEDVGPLVEAEELAPVLSRLPLLEALALCLASNLSLEPAEEQQRLWAAWQPPPRHLRSLEVQCGTASQLPPAAAPHLQQLHTLACDWAVLCTSPAVLAGCTQLRQLHLVANFPGADHPSMPQRVLTQLVDALAALPHLAIIQCFSFRSLASMPEPQLPKRVQRFLSAARAWLPGVAIPPVVVGGHERMRLGMWAA